VATDEYDGLVLPGGGRTLTSWPSPRTDIRNAGGGWVDEVVVTCTQGPNVLVSSRRPDDLPAFCATAIEVFAEHASARAVARHPS
jgi:protease I